MSQPSHATSVDLMSRPGTVPVKPGLPGLLKSRITVEVNGRQPTFVMIIYVKCPEDARRLNKPLSACHR